MNENDISYIVRGSIFKIYQALGPGLLESVYVACLAHELTAAGLKVRQQVPLPVVYQNIKLELGFRIDLMINGLVLIEVKSIELLAPVHHKQVITYLKLSGLKLGILVNFNTDQINKCIVRKVNHLEDSF
jgi:GxxExxY protein